MMAESLEPPPRSSHTSLYCFRLYSQATHWHSALAATTHTHWTHALGQSIGHMLVCPVFLAPMRRLLPHVAPGWPFACCVSDAFLAEGAADPERDALTLVAHDLAAHWTTMAKHSVASRATAKSFLRARLRAVCRRSASARARRRRHVFRAALSPRRTTAPPRRSRRGTLFVLMISMPSMQQAGDALVSRAQSKGVCWCLCAGLGDWGAREPWELAVREAADHAPCFTLAAQARHSRRESSLWSHV